MTPAAETDRRRPREGTDPLLSVVIAVVDGAESVRGCLDAFRRQVDAPPMEILVPYDSTIPEVGELAGEFPEVRFLDLGPVEVRHRLDNAAGQHDLIDQRRTKGLEAATGELVALLEDRGYPASDWARQGVRLHSEAPHAAIGGGVVNILDTSLSWAVYFIDFTQYQPPFAAGPSSYVTDCNVVYKTRALRRIHDQWRHGFQETTVHWALQKRGETTWVYPDLLIEEHRDHLTLGGLAAERYFWGRLFATTRIEATGRWSRLGFALFSPLLPFLLYARILTAQIAKRSHLGTFLRVTPAVILLLLPKALGEMMGYLTGRH